MSRNQRLDIKEEVRVTNTDYFNADPVPAFQVNADPDPVFHFNADAGPYPAPAPAFYQSDGNLRPLVYRPSRTPFEPQGLHCDRLWPFMALALFGASKASEF